MSIKTWLTAAALLTIVGLAPNAQAKPKPAPKPEPIAGVYELSTHKATDSKPACVERWTLRANGTFLIESDQARREGRWKTERDEPPVNRLIRTQQTTNEQPDCRDDITHPPVADETQLYYVNSARGLVLVTEMGQDAKGQKAYRLGEGTLNKVPANPPSNASKGQ